MLSWDEMDKEDEQETDASSAPTVVVTPAITHELESEAASAATSAREVAADDSDAVARAKAALNELDIQEGLDDLEGSAARVHVGDKQMILSLIHI